MDYELKIQTTVLILFGNDFHKKINKFYKFVQKNIRNSHFKVFVSSAPLHFLKNVTQHYFK